MFAVYCPARNVQCIGKYSKSNLFGFSDKLGVTLHLTSLIVVKHLTRRGREGLLRVNQIKELRNSIDLTSHFILLNTLH